MNHSTDRVRRKAVWGSRLVLLPLLLALIGVTTDAAAGPKGGRHRQKAPKARPGAPNSHAKAYKLDGELSKRADSGNKTRTTRVIVTLVPGSTLPAEFSKYKNLQAGSLDIINGQVLDLPNHILKQLAAYPSVFRVHYDRPIETHNYRTAVTVGARDVLMKYGYTGLGVGIAVIDSGVTNWHDDLQNFTMKTFPYGNQRIAKFVDFVNGRTTPYDDNGHGTHVSGIIGGLGYDSNFQKAGIAPLASLVSLKVLDQNGRGSISNLIAALNWVAVNHKTYNIKVVNMSVGAGVHESYWTDPLTLAAKAVTDKGVTIVAAAGNMGRNDNGQLQYGAITAPGNAPWVLTVGASSTMGTNSRYDDQVAGYSSSGPTAFDFGAKPDLVAPGTGTVSLLAQGSTFAATKGQYVVNGSSGVPQYLTLSGTSMAAPVVSGTVALMVQANPNLTPNLIKGILQYTAQPYAGYNALRQGAGFVNTKAAVDMARFFANKAPGSKLKLDRSWSRTIIWGNHLLKGGIPKPTANAWANNIVWGTAKTLLDSGENIVWGTMCGDCDNIVWGTSLDVADNIVWGTDGAENIVWGTSLGGLVGSTLNVVDNIVWGTSGELDNIVWGTALDSLDNIVWGTDCGGADCDNIVWGTSDSDNIVWGTALSDDNIVWGTSDDLDNIVWGTSLEKDVTWGSNAEDQVVYPDAAGDSGFAIDSSGTVYVTEPPVETPPTSAPTTSTITTTLGSVLPGGSF
jgi:serine protease AprX